MSLPGPETREALILRLSIDAPFWTQAEWRTFLAPSTSLQDQQDMIRALQLGQTPASPTFLSVAKDLLEGFLGVFGVGVTIGEDLAGVEGAVAAIKALGKL
jgi:hypothetical protein